MLVRYLVKKTISDTLSAPSHPPFDAARCVNARQSKTACDACMRSCPTAAILEPQKDSIDWNKCINCGICTDRCVAHAFGCTDMQRLHAVKLLSRSRPVAVLGCSKIAEGVDSRAWCLASYRWELIADLALTGRVELVHGDCFSCDRAAVMPCFDEKLEKLRHFLGEERYQRQITVCPAGKQAPREVSRRELFGSMLGVFRPREEEQQENMDALKDDANLRQHLRQQVQAQPPQAERFGYFSPMFSDKCWGCGLCEKVCPVKAISIEKREDGAYMTCTPALCTSCGVCKAICPDHAIDDIQKIRLKPQDTQAYHNLQAGTCEICGALVRVGEATCLRCRVKSNKKR